MPRQVIVQEGAFDSTVRQQINDMFEDLFDSPPVADAVTGPASAVSGNLPAFDGVTGKLVEDSGVAVADVEAVIDGAVIGPASAVAGTLAAFDGTTGKLVEDSGIAAADVEAAVAAIAAGVTAGPFTTITSIEVVDGIVVALTGSA